MSPSTADVALGAAGSAASLSLNGVWGQPPAPLTGKQGPGLPLRQPKHRDAEAGRSRGREPGPSGRRPGTRPRRQGRRVAMARPRPAPRCAPLASQHGGGGGRRRAAGAAGPAAAAGGGGGGSVVPGGGGPADRVGGRLGAAGAAQLLGRLGGAVLQLVLRPLHRLRPHLAGPGGGRQR